jgi:methylmalonyl-CoA mutase, N-terminal domain
VQVTPEYASERLDSAGDRQKQNLRAVRRERDGRAVADALRDLEAAAGHNETNVIPAMIDCALAYASIGEMCDVLRDRFGVWDGPMSGSSA